MTPTPSRREILTLTGAALLAGLRPTTGRGDAPARGQVAAGNAPHAVRVGNDILAAGGTAIDAAVAGGLAAAVTALSDVGIGGYGGAAVVYRADTKTVAAIDFNTAAPMAATPDLFSAADVKANRHLYRWKAVGVPGLLAGFQHLAERHGTRKFGDLLRPAVALARDGFEVPAALAGGLRAAAAALRADPAAAAVLLPGGEPPAAGSTLKNPSLADLLQALAEANSADDFYHGKAARAIAAAARTGGGLLTKADLAAYRPRELPPLRLTWGTAEVHTAPLTAGGLTTLQALNALKALGWADAGPPRDAAAAHARLDALRVAWDDRLRLLGDPTAVDVPVAHLLSDEYARATADRVRAAVRAGKPVAAATDGRPAGGTIHVSAADAAGNLAAVTLTHGESFGARVAVGGLGLVLGHGLSRFDLRPGRPNSPGPGKRPLHNMCPAVVLRDGKPALALGGRGGRRIPNTLFEVFLAYLAGGGLEQAMAAPRLHTEGGLSVLLEKGYPKEAADLLRKVGYAVVVGPGAMVSAVEYDPAARTTHAAVR